MEKITVKYKEFSGSNYEIGYRMGKEIEKIPALLENQVCPIDSFTKKQIKDMFSVFDTWCPGLNEELQGYSDALDLPKETLMYCYMTYLVPSCSQLALLPSLTADQHIYLARNIDFSQYFDDFTLCKTSIPGKYSHIGNSIVYLGRSDGINEHGLAISQTSCGFPVGRGVPGLQEPKVAGLQYWAVIRTLLENYKCVDTALNTLMKMPIAYNLNLLLVDISGTAVLFASLDGNKSYERINNQSDKQYLHSTNHSVLPGLQVPYAMNNSIIRYRTIEEYIKTHNPLSKKDLQNLLLKKYPDGLYCLWYNQFLGTTKSVVYDITQKEINICWGGLKENKWHCFNFKDIVEEKEEQANIIVESPSGNEFEIIKI